MIVEEVAIDPLVQRKRKSIVKTNEELTIPDLFLGDQLSSLNGLRAVAILIVLYSHSIGSMYGGLGVDIFFVISGLLITTLLLKEKVKTGDINLKKFYLRRVIRILPVAYLFILVAILINYSFKLHIPFYHFILAFLFLTNMVGGFGLIGHYWSLSVEEQFYLVFPYFIKRSLKKYIAFLLLLLLFINILDFRNLSPYQYRNGSFSHYLMYLLAPLRHFDGIIVGSLTSIAVFKFNFNLKPLIKYKYLLHLVFVPVIVFLFKNNVSADIFKNPNPMNSLISVSIIAFLMVINLVESDDLIFKFLNNRLVARLGILSYSIYIWQQIFTRDIPWIHSFKYSDSILLNLIGLAIVSGLSYYCYEKQFLKLKARIKA